MEVFSWSHHLFKMLLENIHLPLISLIQPVEIEVLLLSISIHILVHLPPLKRLPKVRGPPFWGQALLVEIREAQPWNFYLRLRL